MGMTNGTLYGFPQGTVFYDARALQARRALTDEIVLLLSSAWQDLNPAVVVEQVETPVLTRPETLKSHAEVGFELMPAGSLEHGPMFLRPETTAGLYALLRGRRKPCCVWQVGKSFRDEALGKFRFDNLRFREFYQLEFELAFSPDTKADYFAAASVALSSSYGLELRDPESLPHYSQKTADLYLPDGDIELGACSLRTDFEFPVCEVSIGLDRFTAYRLNGML